MSNAGPSAKIYLMGHSALDRLAYRHLLETVLGLPVLVESDFTATAVWVAMRSRPQVVLVDTDSPTTEALEAVEMLLRLAPEAKVVVVSAAIDPAFVEPWGRCLLRGFVVKDGGVEDLRAALQAVLADRTYFSEGIRAALERGAARTNGTLRLSRREEELLPLLARGLTLREAAATMSVSYKTADSYRTSLLRKLGVRDRVELARYAIRRHIIEP